MFGNDSPIKRRKRNDDDEMDITPMIDITFLLLIFFIVASNMNPEQTVDLPKAKHGGSVLAPESIVILVREGSGDTARVFKGHDGSEFPAGDLTAQDEEIAAYVDLGVNGAPPFDAPKKHVILKAEANVKTGEVSRVKDAVEKALPEDIQVHVGVLQEG